MGQNVSCLNPAGRLLLSNANNGNATAVRNVLEDKPELANFTFFGNSYNVVHHAASKGHVDVIRSVVETLQCTAKDRTGVDIGDLKDPTIVTLTWSRFLRDVMNAPTSAGETALMLACQNGHVDCATYLMEQGADIFAIDKQLRRSAIHYAAAANSAVVLKRLLDENTRVHTDEGLVALRDVRVHDMSGQCRYIDSRAENGMTALHLAAAFAELDTLQVLLAAGASLMVRTVDLDMTSHLNVAAGSTPLHLAAQRGNVGLVQAMLQAHADALGALGAGGGQRRAWEGDGRIDLRSVANCNRQLPYHVAWQRGFRSAAGILNPTVAIDNALETVRELDQGYGPQKLATLAAYAMRLNLLHWLEQYKMDRAQEEGIMRQKRVVYEQQRKKALEFHSLTSVDAAVRESTEQYRSPADGGHLALAQAQAQPQVPQTLGDVPLGPVVPDSAEPLEQRTSSFGTRRSGIAQGLMAALSQPRRPTHSPTLSQDVEAADPYPPFQSPSRPAPPPPHLGIVPASQAVISPFSASVAPSQSMFASPFSAMESLPRPDVEDKDPAGRPPKHRHGRSVQFRGSLEDAEPSNPSQHSSEGRLVMSAAGLGRPPLDGEANSMDNVWRAIQGSGQQQSQQAKGHDRRLASQQDSLGRSRSLGRALSAGLDMPPLTLSAQNSLDVEMPQSSFTGGPIALLQRVPSSYMRRTLGSLGSFKRGPSRQPSLSGAVDSGPGAELMRQASVRGFDDALGGQDQECGICLESAVEVGLRPCRHRLCLVCATKLCEFHKKPPLCPFCRCNISGFLTQPVVLAPPSAAVSREDLVMTDHGACSLSQHSSPTRPFTAP